MGNNIFKFSKFIVESKKSKVIDYDKKFGKNIEEINKLIKQAKKNDIRAIETDSTWESEYKFDKVVLTKTQVQVHYTEYAETKPKKKVDKISLAKDKEMNFEEVKHIFSWIKKTIKKGYREDAKTQKLEKEQEKKDN
jgi:hypothetical protein